MSLGKGTIALGVIGSCLILLVFTAALLSPWGGPYDSSLCGSTPKITFSEFEQENGTGIYVTKVLEVNGEGYCSLRWDHWSLYLIDDEDLTYHHVIGGSEIIDNYSGNNTLHWTEEELSFERNRSAKISNDNGTEFPIHIQNEMTGPYEDYNRTNTYPRQCLSLSEGDKIKIYGSGSEADGPAKEGWLLRIEYDPTGEIVSKIIIP